MPHDPTNTPLSRPTITLAELAVSKELTSGGSLHLHPEPLLLEEFNHASVVAHQANGDRTNLLNLYLLLAGVFATAAGVSASFALTTKTIGPLLAIIIGLALAAILSFGFFMRLIALSDKYLDALITMDVIKEVYLQELQGTTSILERAIRWRLDSLPHKGTLHKGNLRTSGTTFFIGSIIAVVGSFYVGAATELLYHYTNAFGGAPLIPLYLGSIKISGMVVDVPVFLLAFSFHVLYFRLARGQRRVHASIEAEVEKFGLNV